MTWNMREHCRSRRSAKIRLRVRRKGEHRRETLFAKRLRNDFEASFRAPDSRGLIKSTKPPRATTTTTINTRIIENNAFKRSCRPEARVHAITRLPGAAPSRSFSLSVGETGGKGYTLPWTPSNYFVSVTVATNDEGHRMCSGVGSLVS